jgi:hypothetical protein
MSLSAAASQNRFSSSLSSTGSLTMPPSSAVSRTYLPYPTLHLDMSRGVMRLMKRKPSGPEISVLRSTDTSHTVTSLRSFVYSRSSSS